MNNLVKNPVTPREAIFVMSLTFNLSIKKKNHDLPMIHSIIDDAMHDKQSQRERPTNHQGVNELDVHCTRNNILL
jgi:hypothetical protein